jgi:F0F1-type ATP synthase membrane subunit b/b'
MSEQSATYIADISKEANKQVIEADEQGAEVVREAELFLAKARQDGDSLVSHAQETADGLVARADARGEGLTHRMYEHAQGLLDGAVSRLEELEEQRTSVNAFAHDVRAMLVADAPVANESAASALDDEEN